ncbi:Copine_I [Hexamita inflata]|uniref:Copine_I n=1 Tax=Hexamita inflata TaxID=28002 RepID=A0ABP1HYH8_9EUKA
MGAICNEGMSSEKIHLLTDKYKTFDELNSSMRNVGIESMQCVMGFDFSASNGTLHSTQTVNPYMRVIQILQPVVEKFDDDGEINAYRFGCIQSTDKRVIPLYGNSDICKGFDALMESYKAAANSVEQSGPTTFTHTIQKCIELEKSLGGKQLIVCILITDGGISNEKLDKYWLEEATKYPISFVGIGVGPGPFGILEKFDDKLKGKFDNFQFVNFSEIEEVAKKHERPDLVLACSVFNELPEQFQEMKRLGYL